MELITGAASQLSVAVAVPVLRRHRRFFAVDVTVRRAGDHRRRHILYRDGLDQVLALPQLSVAVQVRVMTTAQGSVYSPRRVKLITGAGRSCRSPWPCPCSPAPWSRS